MKSFFNLLVCAVVCSLSGCDNILPLDTENTLTTRSSNAMYNGFSNVKTLEEPKGDMTMTGDIVCSEPTEYTFRFAFDGSSGTAYEAGIGTQIRLYPYNGSTMRTITVTLPAGTNKCFVKTIFTGSNQQAYARLVIEEVNGSKSIPVNGYEDLTVQGVSKIQDIGGSEPFHTKCPSCGALLGNDDTCPFCGADIP